MTDALPPATLADLLAWRPLPGCRLVLVQDHDGTYHATVDACCACAPIPGRPLDAAALRAALDERAALVLIMRDRRHAANGPEGCRGDVLTSLHARRAEAVGAGDGRPGA